MRDHRDKDTADIWDIKGGIEQFLFTPDTIHDDVTHQPAKPRVRISSDRVTLVGHPHLPPLGMGEIKRLGSIVAVLKERMQHHQGASLQHRYHSSPELPARRSRDEMRHAVMVVRYRDAIQEFKRAEGRTHDHNLRQT